MKYEKILAVGGGGGGETRTSTKNTPILRISVFASSKTVLAKKKKKRQKGRGREEEKKLVAEFEGRVLILNSVYLMVNILIRLLRHLFMFDQQTKALFYYTH